MPDFPPSSTVSLSVNVRVCAPALRLSRVVRTRSRNCFMCWGDLGGENRWDIRSMPQAKHGGGSCCNRNGQSADRLSANLRFFPNCASPFSSFFECVFDISCVFVGKVMSCAYFSKSELDKCLFLLGKCTPPSARPAAFLCVSSSCAHVQQFFVFCLHRFTSLPQLLVLQRFEGEGF